MKRLFFYLIISTLFISCTNTDDTYEVSKRQSEEFIKLFDSYFLLRNNNSYDFDSKIKQLKELLYIYKFPDKSYQNLNDPQFSVFKINFTNWKVETKSEILIKHSEKYCLIGYSANGIVKIDNYHGSIEKLIEMVKFNYNLNIDWSIDSIQGQINCVIQDSLYFIQPYNDDNWYIYEELIDLEDNDLEIIPSEVIDYLEYNIQDKTKLSHDQNLEIGTKYYKRRYYRAALEYFNKYAEGLMIPPQLAYQLGNCYSKTNDYTLSNKFFNMSIEYNHRNSDCYYHLARNQMNLEITETSFKTALNYINKAIELNPKDYGYYGFKGELYLMIGDKNNACNCFEEAIEKGGDEYILYIEQYCKGKEV